MARFAVLFIFIVCCVKWLSGIRVLVEPVIYNRYFPHETDLNSKDWTGECDVPCTWTSDPTDIDGVFYILTSSWDVFHAYLDKERPPITIGGATEGKHSHFLLNHDHVRRVFSASSLMASGSEIPWQLEARDYRELREVGTNPSALRMAVMTASDCVSKNSRERIVMEIDQLMPIARIGECLNNKPWPVCGNRECSKREAIRRYAFCLAFEDGNTPGYVTEKVFDCHRAGSIPVYLGTSEVLKFVPKGSIIYAGDFTSSFDLALYLVEVALNETLYQSYFDWKKTPLDEDFVRLNRPLWDYKIQCRVCRYVWTVQQGLEWDRVTQNFSNETGEVSLEKELDLSDRMNKYRARVKGNGRISPRSFGVEVESDSNTGRHLSSYIFIAVVPLLALWLLLLPCLRILRVRIFSRLCYLKSK